MSQYNTNMRDSSYLEFCAAWSCCFGDFALSPFDSRLYAQAVNAGIVFG